MKMVAWLGAVLLVIGTTGLLLNEFVFDWGSTATLFLAAANVVGLVALLAALRCIRRVERDASQ